MNLLRKLHPVSTNQLAEDSFNNFGFNDLQLVPVGDVGLKVKWSQHLRMSKLFKSGSIHGQSDSSVPLSNSPHRRKRDVLRHSFFRKSSRHDPASDSSNSCQSVRDCKDADPEDRSSTETTSSWEEFNIDDCEPSSSDTDSDSGDGTKSTFVFPPVVIPLGYRQQDRMGGVIVAGSRVLFTFAAFKRHSLKVSQLRPIAEETRCDLERTEPCKWPPSSALRRRHSSRAVRSNTDRNGWI